MASAGGFDEKSLENGKDFSSNPIDAVHRLMTLQLLRFISYERRREGCMRDQLAKSSEAFLWGRQVLQEFIQRTHLPRNTHGASLVVRCSASNGIHRDALSVRLTRQ